MAINAMAVHTKEPAADHVRVTYNGSTVYWTPNSWHSPKGNIPGSIKWMASRIRQIVPDGANITIREGGAQIVLK